MAGQERQGLKWDSTPDEDGVHDLEATRRTVRPVNVIRWSKPGVQDQLNFFMHGYGETDWRILPTADQDYHEQVTA